MGAMTSRAQSPTMLPPNGRGDLLSDKVLIRDLGRYTLCRTHARRIGVPKSKEFTG